MATPGFHIQERDRDIEQPFFEFADSVADTALNIGTVGSV